MKKTKMTKVFSGLSSVFTILFAISMVGGNIALDNAGNVNAALKTPTSMVVKDENASTDTNYHKTTIGDGTFTQKNRENLWKEAYEQNYNEMKEGAALLKNDNHALPLKKDARITLLGHATAAPLYDCMAAGTRVSYAPNHLISYVDAMKNAGFAVNEQMVEALKAGKAVRGKEEILYGFYKSVVATGSATGSEEPISFYEENKSSYANDYQDAAIVMFAREGAEGTDIKMDDDDDVGGSTEKISGLALHKNELDLLKLARRDFKKVIVLLNSPYQLETEEINEYADAVLYVGAPGHRGFQAVADILNGTVNPSGHLSDTYAVNSLSSPAVVNSGTRSPEFGNLAEIRNKLGDPSSYVAYSAGENVERASVQVENIYFGYRYYETRYADTVYGGRGADSAAGSSNGSAWNYASEVSYPFGYGLSYTTFEQKITDFKTSDDEIKVTIEVKNTGDVAGKSAVQLYMQTPYGDYEIKNGVEKSAIELAGFGKSKELKPGESDTVTVTVDKYLLASYDQTNVKGYYLSEGVHYFAIGENVHDALNNILAAQDYDVDGNSDQVKSYHQAFDSETYKKGENGVVVTNRFEDRDLNYWLPGTVTYLSRNDWAGTYPTKQTIVNANDKMIDVLSGKWYKTEDKTSPYYDWSKEARESTLTFDEAASKFLGKETLTLTLPMMRDVPLSDAMWDEFIYQAKLEDIPVGTGENLASMPVGNLSPAFNNGDGCDSSMVRSGYYVKNEETGEDELLNDGMTLRYCSGSILAGSLNTEVIANRGRMMGEEALWGRIMMISGGGYDLHRTPFGGRNFEYKSECPTLTYLVSIPETQAMEATGTHMAPKHFCSNDQETQREGHTVFMREQAFRQGSLRAFEGSLRVAKAGGLMGSFERIGMIWASADYALNTEVLRGEWGFEGFNVTDASKNDEENIYKNDGYFNHSFEGFVAGTTNWCFDTNGVHGKAAIDLARENNDGYMVMKVAESAKYWLHSIATSPVINGLSATDKIISVTPWWQTAIQAIRISTGILAGLFVIATIGCTVYSLVKRDKKEA